MKYLPFTVSMLNKYLQCPKIFWFEYQFMIVPRKIQIPLIVGQTLHNGILTLLQTKREKYAKRYMLTTYNNYITKYKKNNIISTEEELELNKWKIIIESIFDNYSINRKEFIQNVSIIECEKVFSLSEKKETLLKWNDKRIYWPMGKIDAIIKYKDVKYIYDLKTTSILDYDKMKLYLIQVYIYHLIYGDYKINHIYLDCIQKPTIKQKKDEDITDYLTRLTKYYQQPDKYGQLIEPINLKFYNDIINLLYYIIPKIEQEAKLNEIMQKDYEIETNLHINPFNCFMYNAKCKYYLLCKEGINSITMMPYRQKTKPNEELD